VELLAFSKSSSFAIFLSLMGCNMAFLALDPKPGAKIVDRDAFGQRLCNRCGVCVEDFASGREEEGSTRSSGGDSAGGVSRRHQGYASRRRGRSIQSSDSESP
ncbi:Hypothetical predicted protein, partial [Marmota monax]